MRQVIADLLAELDNHLPGAYFGTGGDEINENVYVSLTMEPARSRS